MLFNASLEKSFIIIIQWIFVYEYLFIFTGEI